MSKCYPYSILCPDCGKLIHNCYGIRCNDCNNRSLSCSEELCDCEDDEITIRNLTQIVGYLSNELILAQQDLNDLKEYDWYRRKINREIEDVIHRWRSGRLHEKTASK